jgi:hypothetical protein
MHDPANGLLRIPIPRTPVNNAGSDERSHRTALRFIEDSSPLLIVAVRGTEVSNRGSAASSTTTFCAVDVDVA